MLVLERKRGESIMIGGIKITVVDLRGDKVRIGVEADRSIVVDREEVYLAKQRGYRHAIQASEADIADLGRRVLDPLGVAAAYE